MQLNNCVDNSLNIQQVLSHGYHFYQVSLAVHYYITIDFKKVTLEKI